MKIENIELGPVTLRVRDIEQMKQFYVDVIGMSVLEETEELATLGTKERPLVILHHVPQAKANPSWGRVSAPAIVTMLRQGSTSRILQ